MQCLGPPLVAGLYGRWGGPARDPLPNTPVPVPFGQDPCAAYLIKTPLHCGPWPLSGFRRFGLALIKTRPYKAQSPALGRYRTRRRCLRWAPALATCSRTPSCQYEGAPASHQALSSTGLQCFGNHEALQSCPQGGPERREPRGLPGIPQGQVWAVDISHYSTWTTQVFS